MLKIVPFDKCPLDVLQEMGEITKNARIYLGNNAVNKLRATADNRYIINGQEYMLWKATDKFPSTEIRIYRVCEDWFKVFCIFCSDIAYTSEKLNPDIVIFLEMEDKVAE